MAAETARERFRQLAEAAVRAHSRNIEDRGLVGDMSALQVGLNHASPGLLDGLADAAEAAYGAAPRPPRAKGA